MKPHLNSLAVLAAVLAAGGPSVAFAARKAAPSFERLAGSHADLTAQERAAEKRARRAERNLRNARGVR